MISIEHAMQIEIVKLNQRIHEQKLTIDRLEAALSKERSDRGWAQENRMHEQEAERYRNGG